MKNNLVKKIICSALLAVVTVNTFVSTAWAQENTTNIASSAGAVIEFSESETSGILNPDDYAGIEAFKRADSTPVSDKQNRSATNTSPATALSHPGYYLIDNFTTAPQGKWFSWNPYANSAINDLHTIYLSAPSNYEFLLVDSNMTKVWQLPTNQAIILTYDEIAQLFDSTNSSLNLYLVVQVTSGSTTQPFYLYYGATYKNGSTNEIDTGLVYNIGTLNVPAPQIWYSPAYVYSGMLYNTSVPDYALISSLDLTSDYTGEGMNGAQKYIKTASGYSQSMLGFIEATMIPKYAHPVKQEYQFQLSLRQSRNLVWRPKMRFSYIYPVTDTNIRFVTVKDVR